MAPTAPLIGITCGTPSADQTPRFGTNQAYAQRVQAAGGLVVMVPPSPGAPAAGVIERLDGLLLPGGADVDPRFYGADAGDHLGRTDPDRDELELELLEAARGKGIPVIGICRGMQMINVAFGGTLYQDLPAERPGSLVHSTARELGRAALAHEIDVAPDSWLSGAVASRRLTVNSLHHQAVRDAGTGLLVTARSTDGVIEGLETPDRQTVAVQCHPEELPGLDWARRIFEAFVSSARR